MTKSSHHGYLDFEIPIDELEQKIEGLRSISNSNGIDIKGEIEELTKKSQKLTHSIYSKLTPWQIVQVARHPCRPHTTDYIKAMFTDFIELKGDRVFMDDRALIAGIARFRGIPVAVAGHQKGRGMDEKVQSNFGMSRPEGIRKATRVFRLAQKFSLPVITFIDTPGAYPGIGAEERNQSGAIAQSLQFLSQIEVPVISVVIGEGGSGGALAIGVCDRLIMLKYSYYSVISPEGCASILFKDAVKAEAAAKSLRITAQDLYDLKIADEIIDEGIGGAHRNSNDIHLSLSEVISKNLDNLNSLSKQELVQDRQAKLAAICRYR